MTQKDGQWFENNRNGLIDILLRNETHVVQESIHWLLYKKREKWKGIWKLKEISRGSEKQRCCLRLGDEGDEHW